MSLDTPSNAAQFLPLEYGDVEKDLPEFTAAEICLRNVELNSNTFLSSKEREVQALLELQGSHALRAIDDLIADFVMEKVDEDGMSPIAPFHPPLSREHVEAAVRHRLWAGVQEGTGEKFALLELLAKSSRLKFEVIQHWLDHAEATGLTPVAELEFKHVMPIMAAVDRWFLKMYARKSPFPVQERKARGFTNPTCVMAERDGVPVEVPFIALFPEEIEAMIMGYDILCAQLYVFLPHVKDESLKTLITKKLYYYIALMAALKSGDRADWHRADAKLPQQIRDGHDPIHIHPIETGYADDPIARIPEIGFRVPDLSKDAVEAQGFADRTKARMLQSFSDPSLANIPAVAQTRGLMERSNAALRHFLGVGFEYELKPAGQILPNDPEPRAQGGVDSSLDITTTANRWIDIQKAVTAVFGADFFESVIEARKDIHKEIGQTTASHELGHSVGILEDTFPRLGGADFVTTFIEEWKATVGGVVGMLAVPFGEGAEGVTLDDLRDWIISKIAMACRYALVRHRAGGIMYFRKSLMLMKVMEEQGILVYRPETNADFPWTIDVEDPQKIRAVAEALFEQYKQVLSLYGEGNEEGLRAFLSSNLQPTAFTQFICDRVEVPDMDANSPKNLVTLPAPIEAKPDPREVRDVRKATAVSLAGAVLE